MKRLWLGQERRAADPEWSEDGGTQSRQRENGKERRWRGAACLVLFVMLLTLCACGGVSSGAVPETPSQEAPTQSETPPAQSPSEEETPTPSETPAALTDGGVSTVETPGNGTAITGDAAGNGEAPSTGKAKATPRPAGTMEEEIQWVLDDIITEGMTKREQARAIFDFTRTSIKYTGTSDKSDWQSGAYEGLTKRKGDCFTYYAVSRALLTALEIDNLEVRRVGGPTDHYWNLINCGDGWYHFDATPRSSKMPKFVSFMFTDEEAADYTERAGRNYFTFDSSLYPARAGSEPSAEPEPSAAPEATATPGPEATQEPSAAPEATATPEPEATQEPSAAPEATTEPEPAATPENAGAGDEGNVAEDATQ